MLDFFIALRGVNIILGAAMTLGCLFRLIKLFMFWNELNKIKKLYLVLNLEKGAAWLALLTLSVATTIGSYLHRVYNSEAGVFIPLTTLGMLFTLLAIILSRRTMGIKATPEEEKQ